MDLKLYQALASQLEQVAEILIADHGDRVQFRNEIRLKLAELSGHAQTQSRALGEEFSKTDIKKLIIKIGPWLIAGVEAVAHVLRSVHF
jgi:hypothetical protein